MAKKHKGFFEKVEGEVVREAGSYFKNHVKSTLIRWGEFSIFVLLALIMMSIGMAQLVGFYIPEINNGLNYILVGLIFIFLGMLVRG